MKLLSADWEVLVPYKITLLSNNVNDRISKAEVLVPYKITLLSNYMAYLDGEYGF